ncbi:MULTISPECIES: aromatic amino acid transporter [Aeromonas]|mgnify:FL=1|uniref:Aromatic amino acid permease n=1 Tax=Aeromonas media TaxID=651 RepID=A0A6M4YGL4_AERME|nr:MULTISPECIES: aromatic amino acid transporter [Aeromonas]QIY88271.1 transposase [Aeromonas hydrophila]MBS4701931.1 transposase [Aeromonas media]MCE9957464.1 aromatic amino acid transporter [Aeromonas rivipollensis]MDM5060937.1 aromatic amino acid transporter [Aeromonas rivipollensis]MDW4563591.1 aromatic amino acid transporter [Aeromonas rivipollensis]
MTSKPSVTGGACIIASVCVGAGMLGLPSAGAGAWTSWSSLAIILTMIIMTVSGWMLLEAFKPYELTASFNSVTKDLLGHKINIFNNLTVYFVGGILLYAYITSSGLILSGLLGINSQLASVLFVLVFSCFVWHSTRAVDRISVVLIAFMVLSFVFGVSGLAANIDATMLFHSLTEELGQAPYALAMLPVALTSFGYHHSVASMRAYYGEEQKAKQAILGGTLIALALYLLWLLSIFGNLPRNAFGPIIAKGGDVDVLLGALASVIESKRVSNAINLFSMAAILSSFIGVGLGVFDYLADLFKFDNSRQGRAKSWGVTFLPPLVFSLLFPFGFVVAIGYAGAAATVWACIIPALLAKKSRELAPQGGGFKAPGGQPMVVAVILFGVLTAIFHLMAMAGMLPIYTG